MVTRISAVWLVVLTALPFTAPFATLNVADVFGFAHTSHALVTVGSDACTPQSDDTADDVAMPDATGQRVLPIARTLTPLVTPLSSRTMALRVVFGRSGGETPPARTISARVLTLRV